MGARGRAEVGFGDLGRAVTGLAEATGLSTVPVNRASQEPRRETLSTLRNLTFSALNWNGLLVAAEFAAPYLQLSSIPREPVFSASILRD